MKQSLQLRMSQHLALTPQLQQSIRLLQLSTLELHQELEQILADNPLLERLDDPLDNSVRLLADGALGLSASSLPPDPAPVESTSASTAESDGHADDFPASESTSGSDNDWSFDDVARPSKTPEDDDARPQLEAAHISLREHLQEQARLTTNNLRDCALTELIIDALDDNGYLEESLEDIHARLPGELNIDLDELNIALKLVQSFDPPGVGARNISECLCLQIQRLPKVPFVSRRLALTIAENH